MYIILDSESRNSTFCVEYLGFYSAETGRRKASIRIRHEGKKIRETSITNPIDDTPRLPSTRTGFTKFIEISIVFLTKKINDVIKLFLFFYSIYI